MNKHDEDRLNRKGADDDDGILTKYASEGNNEVSPQHILWGNVLAFVTLHVLAIYGFIACITSMKVLTILWAFILWTWAMLGITAGVHRLWSHKSYKAKAPMRLVLMIGYAIAAEYPPWDWVVYHRVHHKFTDMNADPHNAKRGLFYSHIGWLMMSKHPETAKEEKRADMSDIVTDRIFMFFTKYYAYLGMVFGFVIPTMVPMLCWNESFYCSLSAQLFRYICDTNCAASINSISHKYGYRPYKRDLLPTEGLITSVLTLGEGWHNYHHTFPWDYKASEFGPSMYCISTTAFINLCAKIGWAYDLKQASPNVVRAIAEKHGDGSYYYVDNAAEIG